jgi:hypothetical protein
VCSENRVVGARLFVASRPAFVGTAVRAFALTIVRLQKHEEQRADRDHRNDDESGENVGFDAAYEKNHSRSPLMANAQSSRYLRRAIKAGGALAALSGAILLHLERQRGVPVWNSLWAEDGRVFLSDAIRNFRGTFFEQNGGYIHVVPRVIAGIVAALPVRDAAAGIAVGAAAVVALIAGFVYVASSEVLGSRAARLGLAATVLLLPVPGSELLANTTNLHFYLLFACFWALLWQSGTAFGLGSRATVVVATALSDPLSALFLPLAIVAPFARRSRRALVVSGLFLAALAVHFAIIAGGVRPERNWGFRLGALPEIFALRVAGGLLVGDRFLGNAWAGYGRLFAYGALLLVTSVIVLLLLRSDRRTVAFALISLGYAGLFFCVQLVGRGTGDMDPDLHGFRLDAARYVLLPFLLMTTVILTLVDRTHEHRPGLVRAWSRRAALLWLVGLLAVNYSVTSDRSRGPRWDRELAQARRICSATGKKTARVLVAPSPPHVWFATIPCERI